MNKTVIIQASSKSVGNTNKVVNYLNNNESFDFIDLRTKKLVYLNMILAILMMILSLL
ncbi:hypothetical protein [Tenacibaculum mesophilum]|uniref:hypothetical protein n=1 Tax=Tenacibaculum mesophilum TaxID=104268 RepID=UPI0019D01C8F|nr:hypothetical protein [Tenacibaculum mesophilum]